MATVKEKTYGRKDWMCKNRFSTFLMYIRSECFACIIFFGVGCIVYAVKDMLDGLIIVFKDNKIFDTVMYILFMLISIVVVIIYLNRCENVILVKGMKEEKKIYNLLLKIAIYLLPLYIVLIFFLYMCQVSYIKNVAELIVVIMLICEILALKVLEDDRCKEYLYAVIYLKNNDIVIANTYNLRKKGKWMRVIHSSNEKEMLFLYENIEKIEYCNVISQKEG